MTDFDKLIKEKTEQAEYAYKPSAWRSFKRVAGTVKPLRYWVLGSVSAVLLGGAVATAVHFASNRPQQEVGNQPVLAIDSTLSETEPLSGVSDETPYSTPISTAQNESSVRSQTSMSANQPESAPDATTVQRTDSTKQLKNRQTRLGRPIVIDVDTIKENVPTDEELRNGHSRLY